VAWTGPPREASPVSSTASWGWKVTAATAHAVTGAPTSPGLVTAATDSRSLAPVARDVYRFQAISLRLRDVEMIHGTDEHLTLANLERLIQFYGRLIETAAG